MLDVTNCNFIENIVEEIYLDIPVKRLYKSKLKG